MSSSSCLRGGGREGSGADIEGSFEDMHEHPLVI
jgi:hypothetical protein